MAARNGTENKLWTAVVPARLVGVCLMAAGGLMSCLLFVLSIQGAPPLLAQSELACIAPEEQISDSPLRINEIMADNNGSLIDPADGKDNEDWLELYNPSDQMIDLQGSFLSDRLGELRKHRITESLTIEPFGFLVLFLDGETSQGPNHLSFKLKNSGEAVVLTESDGVTIIDSCIFGQQSENQPIGRLPDGREWTMLPSATPNEPNAFVPVVSDVRNEPEIPSGFQSVTVRAIVTDDLGVASVTLYYSSTNLSTQTPSSVETSTFERTDDSLYTVAIPGLVDNTLVSYYIEATDTSGGKIRSPIDAPATTHKYLVGYEPPKIAINEIMADNSMSLIDPTEPVTATIGNKYPDWFEIYNYGTTFVNLNGLYLTDDRYKPTKNPITATVFVPPGSSVIIYADEDRRQGPDHVNFRLAADGESVGIFGPYGAALIDIVDFDSLEPDKVIGRFPDGTGPLTRELCRSPGARNIQCALQTYLPAVPLIAEFQLQGTDD